MSFIIKLVSKTTQTTRYLCESAVYVLLRDVTYLSLQKQLEEQSDLSSLVHRNSCNGDNFLDAALININGADENLETENGETHDERGDNVKHFCIRELNQVLDETLVSIDRENELLETENGKRNDKREENIIDPSNKEVDQVEETLVNVDRNNGELETENGKRNDEKEENVIDPSNKEVDQVVDETSVNLDRDNGELEKENGDIDRKGDNVINSCNGEVYQLTDTSLENANRENEELETENGKRNCEREDNIIDPSNREVYLLLNTTSVNVDRENEEMETENERSSDERHDNITNSCVGDLDQLPDVNLAIRENEQFDTVNISNNEREEKSQDQCIDEIDNNKQENSQSNNRKNNGMYDDEISGDNNFHQCIVNKSLDSEEIISGDCVNQQTKLSEQVLNPYVAQESGHSDETNSLKPTSNYEYLNTTEENENLCNNRIMLAESNTVEPAEKILKVLYDLSSIKGNPKSDNISEAASTAIPNNNNSMPIQKPIDKCLINDSTSRISENEFGNADENPKLSDLILETHSNKTEIIESGHSREQDCTCCESHRCLQVVDMDETADMLTENQLISVDTGSVSDWLYRVNPAICLTTLNVMEVPQMELQPINAQEVNYCHIDQEVKYKVQYINNWLYESDKFCSNDFNEQ